MTAERNFWELLAARMEEEKHVCVGLDSDEERIPDCLREVHRYPANLVTSFNSAIVDATGDLVLALKMDLAFYEALGDVGIRALQDTIRYTRNARPGVPVIGDANRTSIANANRGYASFLFDYLGLDAITVHPYLGAEALGPFLERKEKGIFVLCRTSNPGAGEFQDLLVPADWSPEGRVPLYQQVAHRVAKHWNRMGNCGVVVGATYSQELHAVRQLVGDAMLILIPGIGAQGGDLEATVNAGKNSKGHGMIINVSRAIIFASSGKDFAQAARAAVVDFQGQIRAKLEDARVNRFG
ncbi:MAG: orotidine-5'-phosphate decarboxylase [Patescibacteria group bacterium]